MILVLIRIQKFKWNFYKIVKNWWIFTTDKETEKWREELVSAETDKVKKKKKIQSY